MRFTLVLAGLVLAALPLRAALAHDTAAARALGGGLAVDGQSVAIAGQLTAAVSRPSQTDSKSAKSYAKALPLLFGAQVRLSAGPVEDAAAMGAMLQGGYADGASSAIQSVAVRVTTPTTPSLLAVSAAAITSTAGFSWYPASSSPRTVTGTAGLSGLTVDLSGLGGGIHRYSGTPKPNTVLFRSKDGSIIVYLNRQVTNVTVPAAPAAAASPDSIEVDAVDIHLTDANVQGNKVSGDIRIGSSLAGE